MAETNLELITQYLKDSLMLSTPLIENDPAFESVNNSLPSIIKLSALTVGKTDIEELTPDEINIVVLKSLYTIYMRLAVAVAPEYDVSAEQVTFKKGDRVYHYTSLADKIKEQLDETIANSPAEVKNLIIRSRDGSLRNYNLSTEQTIKFKVNSSNVYSFEVEWNRYDMTKGNFYKYSLMYSKEPIYDEYAEEKLRDGSDVTRFDFYDIKRTKYRLTDLEPDTEYYLVIVFYGRDLANTVSQITAKTLSEDDIHG